MHWTKSCLFSAVLVLVASGWSTSVRGQTPGVVPQTPDQAAATSLAAALRIFDGTDDPMCRAVAGDRACVNPQSSPEQAARGIATFGVGESGPDAVGGFAGILGRDPMGEWQFWFGTQNIVYQLLILPGAMTVCADGDGLNVRALPSTDAEILATLPDLARVMAEQFTLTQPGTPPTVTSDQVIGSGWYYLSAPVEGWASSLHLENAALPSDTMQPPCAIRNIFVRP